MAGFIFGGNTGTTYDELQRKRAIAEQLMEGRSGPMRPVDGIASAAESITGALLGKKLDKQKSKLDDDWMASAAAQGLDPQRLAILKELSPQQRNAYMLQRMDAKPTGGGGGPSKSDIANEQATAAILAALNGGDAQPDMYSTGSSPDPSVNAGFTSGENLSFGQPAPQTAGYTPPPVTGPIPESQWGVTDVAQAAIDRAAPPAAPMQAPATPQPTQGLSFGTPLAVSQDTGQGENGLTLERINAFRLQAIAPPDPLVRKQMLAAADAMEKTLTKVDGGSAAWQEYQEVKSQNDKLGRPTKPFEEFRLQKSIAGNPSNPSGPDAGKFSEEAAKIITGEASAIMESGKNARRNLLNNNRMEGLIGTSPQGMTGAIKTLAGDFGIKTEGSSDIESLTALINQLVPQQRAPGSGTMSDADLALFKRSLPRLINTPEGNKTIVETMRAIAEYDVEMSKIARNLILGKISADEAFEQYDAVSNPLAVFRADAPAEPGAMSVEDAMKIAEGLAK